jgi:hypothetical protein
VSFLFFTTGCPFFSFCQIRPGATGCPFFSFFCWYGPDDGAGFLGAFVGAFILLMIIGAVRKRDESS